MKKKKKKEKYLRLNRVLTNPKKYNLVLGANPLKYGIEGIPPKSKGILSRPHEDYAKDEIILF